MIKQPIRNLHSSRPTPQRFCDVIVDGEKVYLEQKISKYKYITIPWEDVVHQVKAAIAVDKEKLPQSAP
ncbi:hypothetical protein [Syntrophomonas erecta]|jgi:hypothetical protein|nr:hypothetical protein [Desulfitobacteriaceae bacterium]